MKNNINKQKIIKIPDLKINGVWGKIIYWISHVRHIYWLILISIFLLLFIIFLPQEKWIKFWVSLKSQRLLVGMLLAFSLITVSLIWSTAQHIDEWVFMYLNMHGKRTQRLDWTMQVFTQIGNGAFAVIIGTILYLQGNHRLAYELVFGTLVLWLIVEILKIIFHRARPFNKLKKVRIVGTRANGYSFPSGHTSQSFFLVTLLLNYYQLSLFFGFLLYITSLLVGITRIYVGMHYPRDVLGGAILGSSFGFIGAIVHNYIL